VFFAIAIKLISILSFEPHRSPDQRPSFALSLWRCHDAYRGHDPYLMRDIGFACPRSGSQRDRAAGSAAEGAPPRSIGRMRAGGGLIRSGDPGVRTRLAIGGAGIGGVIPLRVGVIDRVAA